MEVSETVTTLAPQVAAVVLEHGQQRNVLDWPYTDALRMDEAMHPLAILAVGLYGKTIKRLHCPDARFTAPGVQGRVQAKTSVSLPWESDEGELLVFHR